MYVKTVFDLTCTILLLPIIISFILIISLILLFLNRGRIFFIQSRTGKNHKIFKILKFRTLQSAETHNSLNAFCSFLRQTHLDELPQVFNILSGNMSIVGPRPLLPDYLPYYDSRTKAIRHTVKPGVTGLTQISGGKYLNWSRRFSLDLFYIQHCSMKFDLYILLKTLLLVRKLFRKEKPQSQLNDISYINYVSFNKTE